MLHPPSQRGHTATIRWCRRRIVSRSGHVPVLILAWLRADLGVRHTGPGTHEQLLLDRTRPVDGPASACSTERRRPRIGVLGHAPTEPTAPHPAATRHPAVGRWVPNLSAMGDDAVGGRTGRSATAPTNQGGSAWSPLRSRIFLALFLAQLVSNLGTNMQTVGSAWLLGDLGATPAIIAMVQTATFLPVLFVGIPAGVMADLFDRRLILIGTQTSMMVAAAAMAGFTFADAITPLGVLALTFALGTGMSMTGPAWQAIQPDLVDEDDFPQAVTLSSMTFNVGRAIGPAIGGVLIASAGAGWVFTINAVSFLGTILVLVAWRPAAGTTAPAQREPWTSAMIAGVRYGKHSPLVRTVLVRTMLLMLPGAALAALLPVVVRGPLEWSSNGYGLLLGIYGTGAVIGAIARPRITARLHNDALMRVCSAVLIGVILVQGLVDQRVVVGVAELLGGCAFTLAATTVMVSAQEAMPAWVRARGLAIFSITLTGSIAVGSMAWGFVANASIAGAHVAAAALMSVNLVAAFRWKLTRGRRYDLRAVPYDLPIVALEPEPDDGPVLVTVTYTVPSDRIEEFLDVMRPVEGHRRRTGGYQWAVYRDLRTPTQFVETYLVSSWAEHLRQRQRRTAAILELLGQLRPFVVDERAVGHWISATSKAGRAPLFESGAFTNDFDTDFIREELPDETG
jgi:MFS family permease